MAFQLQFQSDQFIGANFFQFLENTKKDIFNFLLVFIIIWFSYFYIIYIHINLLFFYLLMFYYYLLLLLISTWDRHYDSIITFSSYLCLYWLIDLYFIIYFHRYLSLFLFDYYVFISFIFLFHSCFCLFTY